MCVVIISNIVWDKFASGTGTHTPFLLHFPGYTRDQMLEIMQRDHDSNPHRGVLVAQIVLYLDDVILTFIEDLSFSDMFGKFGLLLWSVFQGACRDLNELRHLSILLFPIYLQPVISGWHFGRLQINRNKIHYSFKHTTSELLR